MDRARARARGLGLVDRARARVRATRHLIVGVCSARPIPIEVPLGASLKLLHLREWLALGLYRLDIVLLW